MSVRLDASAFVAAALEGDRSERPGALGGCPYRLVELDPHPRLHPEELAALSRWLGEQACPVVGIAAAGCDHPLARACDAVATSEAEAAGLLANIAAAPLAALVLVQLLRATEGLDVARALTFESLAYATLQAGAEFRRWLARAERPTACAGSRAAPAVLTVRDGAHLTLRLNRPERRNALSVEMRDALVEALELVDADPSITSVTVSGAGRCFCAGGDLAEFGSTGDAPTAHAVRALRPVPALLARCAARLTFRVHGAAVGAGVEMAAFGGRLEATADAFFQLPEIRFGLIPGCGGCVSLPRRIGRLRTGYLALSARRLDARTARGWGLVDALTGPATAAALAQGESQ
jgi:enoyl-CoA hydratase